MFVFVSVILLISTILVDDWTKTGLRTFMQIRIFMNKEMELNRHLFHPSDDIAILLSFYNTLVFYFLLLFSVLYVDYFIGYF